MPSPQKWITSVTQEDAGLAVLSQTARKKATAGTKPARFVMILDKLTEGSGILTREEWIRSQLKKIDAASPHAGPAPEGTAKFLEDLWADSEWFLLDEAGKIKTFEDTLEKSEKLAGI